jgi:hypothetical protein
MVVHAVLDHTPVPRLVGGAEKEESGSRVAQMELHAEGLPEQQRRERPGAY